MKYVLFICLTILLFNCKNTDQAYIQTIIQEWTNKKIIFPDDIQAKIVGRDTNCNYLLLKPIKILVYVDSIGCTACKLNFYDWYQKINSLGKITDLAFLFYVNTKILVKKRKALSSRKRLFALFHFLNEKIYQKHIPGSG